MSDNEGLSTPDLVGSSTASNDSWDDEPNTPSEKVENETSEGGESLAEPKAKAAPKPAPEAKPEAPKAKPEELFEFKGRKLTRSEIERELEKIDGSDRKFREAADMRKQMEAFVENFKKDPLSVLMQDGLPIDRKSLGEKLLLAELEREMLTPEQRKLQEYEAKLKDFETKEQQAKREAEERETEQKREMKRQEISQMFAKAMEATPLSKSPETAQFAMEDMAKLMRIAKERGINLGPEDLAKHAESKYYKGMRALAENLDAKTLIEVLGSDIIKKLRKHDLEQLKSNDQQFKTHKDDSWEVEGNSKSSKSTKLDPYAARMKAREMLFGK
jgi:hypothetical protein